MAWCYREGYAGVMMCRKVAFVCLDRLLSVPIVAPIRENSNAVATFTIQNLR